MKDENGNEMSLRGKSIGGGNAVITRLNGVDVDLTGNYSTIVVQHIDKKGTLAFVTAVLSAYDLNIGSLRLYRESKGKMAYAIIEVDTTVSNQVVNALRGLRRSKMYFWFRRSIWTDGRENDEFYKWSRTFRVL